MSGTEIEASDVVKIILQFCKENELKSTFESLQSESGVTLNTVDDLDVFMDDIKEGKWDKVLLEVSNLKLPVKKLEALHELIVLELIELREVDTARSLLRKSEALALLREDDEDKYLSLEKACNRTVVDAKQLYGGVSRQKRRNMVAGMLKTEVRSVLPSRLMVLIGQAIKWQKQEGIIPDNGALDVFSGTVPTTVDEEDIFPSSKGIAIAFGSKSYPECVTFFPDGSGFVTGSFDGFIEVWDVWTGALKLDLDYQKNEKFMMHESSVLSTAISLDGTWLASGSKDGQIKVWKLSSGQCLKTFDAAHADGVTSLVFSREKNRILSSSFDGTIRIHGIKSGKLLKEFRGHDSFVHSAVFSPDQESVISSSADCSICIWDTSSGDCTRRFRVPEDKPGIGAVFVPSLNEHVLVTGSGTAAHLMTVEGELIRSFAIKTTSEDTGTLVGSALSNRGEFVMTLTEAGTLTCFELKSGRVLDTLQTGMQRAIGLSMHPMKNLIACYSQEGVVQMFKA
jgi:WD40 repeat-containing protein SMU1